MAETPTVAIIGIFVAWRVYGRKPVSQYAGAASSGTAGAAISPGLDPLQRRLPALTDPQAAELAQQGLKIEQLYQQPMDIEWALAEGRLAILQARPITAAARTLAAVAAMGVGTAAQQTSSVVRVDSGQLQGMIDDGVVSNKGIPFAAPPVGELRWRPPQQMAPWTGAPMFRLKAHLVVGPSVSIAKLKEELVRLQQEHDLDISLKPVFASLPESGEG